jgi:hypothetical protein
MAGGAGRRQESAAAKSSSSRQPAASAGHLILTRISQQPVPGILVVSKMCSIYTMKYCMTSVLLCSRHVTQHGL